MPPNSWALVAVAAFFVAPVASFSGGEQATRATALATSARAAVLRLRRATVTSWVGRAAAVTAAPAAGYRDRGSGSSADSAHLASWDGQLPRSHRSAQG